MMKPRSSLAGVILTDLVNHYKLPILLVICIIASALAVLVTTQETRKLLYQREQLLLERDVLESEWRNLILEENVLGDQKRIEQKAISQLNMQSVNPKEETIIVTK